MAAKKNYNGLSCYGASDDGCAFIRKAHLAPDEMYEGNSNALVNPFGGTVYVRSTDKLAADDKKAVTIELNGLPIEACIELSSLDWGNAVSGLMAIVAGSSSSTLHEAYVGCTGEQGEWRNYGCPNGSAVSLPIPVSLAVSGCSDAGDSENDQYRNFGIKFY